MHDRSRRRTRRQRCVANLPQGGRSCPAPGRHGGISARLAGSALKTSQHYPSSRSRRRSAFSLGVVAVRQNARAATASILATRRLTPSVQRHSPRERLRRPGRQRDRAVRYRASIFGVVNYAVTVRLALSRFRSKRPGRRLLQRLLPAEVSGPNAPRESVVPSRCQPRPITAS